MTFEDLDRRFPNGFDDAEITLITVDYEKRLATLQLNLRGNPPDSLDRDVYEPAVLKASGIYYLAIEPPDFDHLSYPKRDRITVDGLRRSARFPPVQSPQTEASCRSLLLPLFRSRLEFVHSYRRGRRRVRVD